jgi:hypothetical protein
VASEAERSGRGRGASRATASITERATISLAEATAQS